MAQRKVSVQDKATIKKRLAQGKSLRGALEGTNVKSPTTAKAIRDKDMDDIEQIRKEYLVLIESFNAHEIDTARLWAKMTRATKKYAKKEIPDWQSREKALRYIDSLRGIVIERGADIQVGVSVDNRKMYVVLPEEYKKEEVKNGSKA